MLPKIHWGREDEMKRRMHVIEKKKSYKLIAELLQEDQKKDLHYPNSFGVGQRG